MKILTIENDFISRNYLCELFSLYGYDSISARNAADGLDSFLSDKPDLVVCSVLLPGMSGLEFLNHIRSVGYNTPVIMLASHSSERLVIQSFRMGANDFLKKPVQDSQIIPIVERFANTAASDKQTPERYGDVLEGKVVYTFDTEIDAPYNIVRRLISEINPEFFDEGGIVNIELGLTELITNAIEHGNLNITFEEKTLASETNTLIQLMQNRLMDERYQGRRVTVTYEYNNEECRWTIADEGDGFDVSIVPDPTKVENLESLHGRGIYFTRFFFDSLEYLGNGNTCVVVKKRGILM